MSHKIEIYGIRGCLTCTNARKFAALHKLDFEYICMSSDPSQIQIMKDKAEITGNCSAPQIFVDDDHLGGFVEFKRWIKSQTA